ncbi:MAG: RsmB/NOP family class I SAM-dependent RNA methyltransferase [Alphaproteobacteria bacterium TMED93]|nr:MAG: RsmB/NOP family class I SAM-dependent RNA methyltransferase [Alphaproteobacteria bacterium TMED93]|tara:strand:- start:747 stop:2000 length:1254 start_codon:yes stop_codon:yes gene_type:complete
MRQGAILKSSIELIYQIVENNKNPKLEIKNYFRINRFAGAKDKRLIQEIVFKYLKNYFSLKKICKENLIKFNIRNSLLVYFFSENKKKTLKDIYEGKYSINPETQDKKVYNAAVNLKYKILPVFPEWLEKKTNKNIRNNLNEIYKSILLEPRFDIRVNNLVNRGELLNLLNKNNIPSKKSEFSTSCITILKRVAESKISLIKNNFFEIQDEGSQIVTMLASARSGMKVLDYCAGKGTKTLALFEQMKGKGIIYAYEENLIRLNHLKKRLALQNLSKDISIFYHDKIFANYFDLVLLDVPCTGSGVWRRRPESIIRINKNSFKEHLKVQKEILNKASKYCKKNGIIAYITCSIFENENENQIMSFLKKNKDFEVLDINNILKKKINQITFNNINQWLTLSPSDINSDGFFICLLRKYA